MANFYNLSGFSHPGKEFVRGMGEEALTDGVEKATGQKVYTEPPIASGTDRH